jgi:hypothetical protein
MADKRWEPEETALARWESLYAIQDAYPYTEKGWHNFLADCQMAGFGWTTSPIQFDMASFMLDGGSKIMIQAQRGQAKTTLASIFAVFSLVHDPKHRVLILSGGQGLASDIAKGIQLIIGHWDVLECLRPDANAGDRTSTDKFDVHFTLRGINKTASITTLGISSNLQGNRADLLIPDDVETGKNSLTALMREQLLQKTLDFASICESQHSRIMYLGTPQTVDSIYNTLPGRGYTVRIWPGRYPTLEEELEYGDMLAPVIKAAVACDPGLRTGGGIEGTSGKAIDTRLDEAALCSKELEQGPAYFKLQHMLSTKLADSMRYPLKPENLITMPLNPEKAPGEILWARRSELEFMLPTLNTVSCNLYGPAYTSNDWFDYEGRAIYIDPAGGGKNGDETAYAVTFFMHGYVFLMDAGGIPGGLEEEKMQRLADLVWKWKPNIVQIEKNYGNGALSHNLYPVMRRTYESNGGSYNAPPAIEDVWESGQKELRIIDVLEPVIARHHLIVADDIWERDVSTTQHYAMDKRSSYSFLHQLSRITRDKGCLGHDDRLDAVAGAVRLWVERMNIDEQKRLQSKRAEDTLAWMKNPWGRETPFDMKGHAPNRVGGGLRHRRAR